MARQDVEALIRMESESPKRIAVVGDCMTDVYVHGRLADSQDGCQKFVETERYACPGGAANAANCLACWSSEVRLYTNPVHDSPLKVRFLAEDRIVFRHDCDECTVAEGAAEAEIAAMLRWQPDVILVSDYDKGFLSPELLRTIIDEATCPVIVDAKRRPELYRGAILKCNRQYAETYSLAGRPQCVITNGGDNPTAVTGDFLPVPCVNHVGAGDCFAAHLALALAHWFSLECAAEVAHSAGRVYVQRLHNHPPRPEEILRDCS